MQAVGVGAYAVIYDKENGRREFKDEESWKSAAQILTLHREDGPAVEFYNKDREWYLNGKRHRIDGPAVERADGNRFWFLNGLRHRADGPAIEYANGTKFWYSNGLIHRVDGPAIITKDGSKSWMLNNQAFHIIPRLMLDKYMEANNLTLAHLLTDNDTQIRESALALQLSECFIDKEVLDLLIEKKALEEFRDMLSILEGANVDYKIYLNEVGTEDIVIQYFNSDRSLKEICRLVRVANISLSDLGIRVLFSKRT